MQSCLSTLGESRLQVSPRILLAPCPAQRLASSTLPSQVHSTLPHRKQHSYFIHMYFSRLYYFTRSRYSFSLTTSGVRVVAWLCRTDS